MCKTGSLILLALCTLLLLASCSLPAPTAAPTSAPVATAVPATPSPTPLPTPAPTPSPTPIPTATLSPTPVPTPTSTPDPWAGFFTTKGAHLTVVDQETGPWIYKDETLSVRVDLLKSGTRKYCRAEIYTRGPLPFGGFAYRDDTGRKRALPYLIARQNKAVLAITGDFAMLPGNAKGVMIRNGKVYHDKKQAPTLAVMPDGELRVYEPGKIMAKQLLAMGVKDSFAFGPILVKDGKVHKSVNSHPLKRGNWRTAIGQVEKGHYICIVTIGGFTLPELAKLFIQNKCTVAYNLDGGHSASMVFMGEQLYRGGRGRDNMPQRSLSDVLLIGTCSSVPGEKDPVYCDGISINKKNKPKPTDGPIAKNNGIGIHSPWRSR